MNMYRYVAVLAAFLTQDTQDTVLGKLGEYGVLGVFFFFFFFKDYKNEQFLQKLIDDLKDSFNKISDTIDKKLP